MSDGILSGVSLAELADYFNEVDLEYTWLREPQTMTHSDEVAQLRASIAELERERDALRLSLNTTNVIVNDQIGKIADLIKERDAAIADAVKLARFVEEFLELLLDEDRVLLEKYLNK